jgi:hypothetical protein
MRKLGLVMIAFVVVSANCIGQDYLDIAKVKNGFVPNNKYKEVDGETVVNNFLVKVTYPIVISDKLVFLTGVDYSNINLKPLADSGAVNLMSSGIRLGVSYNHTDKLKGIYLAIPKFTGNYKSGTNKYFQVGGVALWKYKVKENLIYKFGVYGSSEVFGFYTTPILGIYYLSLNKKFELNLSLPISADINYKVLKNIRVGVEWLALTAGYDLNEYTMPSSYIQKTTQEAGGYLQFDFWKEQLILKTKFLYTMSIFRLYGDAETVDFGITGVFINDKRKQINNDFQKGIGFEVSLAYRFHIKKKEEAKKD